MRSLKDKNIIRWELLESEEMLKLRAWMAGWAIDWDTSCDGSGNRSEGFVVFSNFVWGGMEFIFLASLVRAKDKACGAWTGRSERCKSLWSIILSNQAMFAMTYVFVSVNSSFFLECVLQKEVLHPLLVSIQIWVSCGGEGGVYTLLNSMELGCLARATYFKWEQPFPILMSWSCSHPQSIWHIISTGCCSSGVFT